MVKDIVAAVHMAAVAGPVRDTRSPKSSATIDALHSRLKKVYLPVERVLKEVASFDTPSHLTFGWLRRIFATHGLVQHRVSFVSDLAATRTMTCVLTGQTIEPSDAYELLLMKLPGVSNGSDHAETSRIVPFPLVRRITLFALVKALADTRPVAHADETVAEETPLLAPRNPPPAPDVSSLHTMEVEPSVPVPAEKNVAPSPRPTLANTPEKTEAVQAPEAQPVVSNFASLFAEVDDLEDDEEEEVEKAETRTICERIRAHDLLLVLQEPSAWLHWVGLVKRYAAEKRQHRLIAWKNADGTMPSYFRSPGGEPALVAPGEVPSANDEWSSQACRDAFRYMFRVETTRDNQREEDYGLSSCASWRGQENPLTIFLTHRKYVEFCSTIEDVDGDLMVQLLNHAFSSPDSLDDNSRSVNDCEFAKISRNQWAVQDAGFLSLFVDPNTGARIVPRVKFYPRLFCRLCIAEPIGSPS